MLYIYFRIKTLSHFFIVKVLFFEIKTVCVNVVSLNKTCIKIELFLLRLENLIYHQVNVTLDRSKQIIEIYSLNAPEFIFLNVKKSMYQVS